MDPRRRRHGSLVVLVAAGVLAVAGVLLAGPFPVAAPVWSEPSRRLPVVTPPPQPQVIGRPGGLAVGTQRADGVLYAVLGVVGVAILAVVVVWLIRRLRDRAVRLDRAIEPDAPMTDAARRADGPIAAPVMRRGLERALELLERPGDPSDAVVRAWVGLEETALDAGAPRHPAETPSEYAGRVVRRFDADRAAADELRRLYERVRFGGAPADGAAVDRARLCLGRLRESWARDAETAGR